MTNGGGWMAGGEKQKGANLCSPVIVIISLLLWLTRSDPHVAPGQRQSPRRGRFSLLCLISLPSNMFSTSSAISWFESRGSLINSLQTDSNSYISLSFYRIQERICLLHSLIVPLCIFAWPWNMSAPRQGALVFRVPVVVPRDEILGPKLLLPMGCVK